MIRYTHTRLLVDHFVACHRFYREVMGFKPRFNEPKGPYEEFETDGVTLALFDRKLMSQAIDSPFESAKTAGTDRVVLCFAVANVDDAHAALAKRGVQFAAGPTDRPDWSIRTAHLRDPDGNLLEINSPLSR
jgi:lactoylglutathione lyase